MQAARGAAVAAEAPAGSAAPRRARWLFVTAALVLVADLVSKHIVVAKLSDRLPSRCIPHVLTLTLTRNAGAAFSIGTGATLVFSAVAIAVIVVIVADGAVVGLARLGRRARAVAGWRARQPRATGSSAPPDRFAGTSSTGSSSRTGRCSTWPTRPS